MNSGLCEHCLRVAYLVTDMTILLGMDEKATMDVQLAAIYHDIGKTQIPEQVLNKPGKLTPGEYFIMKLHAEIGYRMIQCHTSPETAQMVLYHHEDYDGGGYFGLQGNDIPYGARILRICDVYDALTSFRCYREPCSPEKALQYLKNNAGTKKYMKSKGDFVMKSFSKAFGRIVLILTVVIALVASVFVVPKLFGINPYVVLSGSMEPQIHTGAIAFVNTKDTAVKVGDVVTYRLANDELVTHRIIKKDQSEYTFQGDANDNPDARTVTQDQIVGKYLFSIPKVGFLISALGKKGMPVIIAWIIILNIMSLILESTCSSGDKKKTAEPQNED